VGISGRKTIVDCYGSMIRHGGASLSGKGPDEDRPVRIVHGALSRQEIVAAGLASRCEIRLAYVIGMRTRYPSNYRPAANAGFRTSN